MSKRRILIKSKIEYVSHAVNFCVGCAHGCMYPCYARKMQRKAYHDWLCARPVPDAPEILRDEIVRLKEPPTEILVSSSHDAYQPQDGLPTRQILEVLAEAEMPAWILTKGGLRAINDLDLLQRPGAWFGVSITTLDENMRQNWEPGAASIHERFIALVNAKIKGIQTWVSAEPVLPGLDLFALARRLKGLADWVVVGRWNYHRQAERMNWTLIREQADAAFTEAGIPFLIKGELAHH